METEGARETDGMVVTGRGSETIIIYGAFIKRCFIRRKIFPGQGDEMVSYPDKTQPGRNTSPFYWPLFGAAKRKFNEITGCELFSSIM